MRIHLIGADDGEDDLHLVAESVGERRAKRAVGQTAGKDGLLGGAAFATEERTGDLAGGVGALLDVDREREEVDAGAYVLRCVGRGEHDALADGGDDSALALEGQFARLKGQGLVGGPNGTRHSDGVSHDELLSRRREPFGLQLEQWVGSQWAGSAPR